MRNGAGELRGSTVRERRSFLGSGSSKVCLHSAQVSSDKRKDLRRSVTRSGSSDMRDPMNCSHGKGMLMFATQSIQGQAHRSTGDRNNAAKQSAHPPNQCASRSMRVATGAPSYFICPVEQSAHPTSLATVASSLYSATINHADYSLLSGLSAPLLVRQKRDPAYCCPDTAQAMTSPATGTPITTPPVSTDAACVRIRLTNPFASDEAADP